MATLLCLVLLFPRPGAEEVALVTKPVLPGVRVAADQATKMAALEHLERV
jgi:hypothetical protein